MTPPESDTPRSDKVACCPDVFLSTEAVVPLEFARQLERELAARKGYVLEWVSVSERLPEDFPLVLVDGGVAYREPEGDWVTKMTYPPSVIEWKVTHWMPLPRLAAAPSATNEEGKDG